MNNGILIDKCPLCTSKNINKKWYVNNFKIDKCSSCSFYFANPLPTDKFLDKFYSERYFSGGKGTRFGYENYQDSHKNNNKKSLEYSYFLSAIKRYVSSGKLLEVGCATGDFLFFAKKDGWQVTGIEKSDYCREVINKRNLFKVYKTIEEAGFKDEMFDVIFSSMTIEHLVDPVGFVRVAYRLLRPGGILFIRTVDIGSNPARLNNLAHKFGRKLWSEIKPPEHLFYFSKKTLRYLLNKFGFNSTFISDCTERRFAEVGFNNPVLKLLTLVFRPILYHISANSNVIILGIK